MSDSDERVYKKSFGAGRVVIPTNTEKDSNRKFGIPHAAIVVAKSGKNVKIPPWNGGKNTDDK